jgi:hypothetical protein
MGASRTTIRIGAALLSAASLAAVTVGMAGCGPSSAAQGVVSGKVTYNGTPLTGGNLTLHPVKGGPDFPITITNEGTFSSSGVPDGEMLVAIETESLNGRGAVGMDGSRMPKPPPGKVGANEVKNPHIDMSNQPKYMRIPQKYKDVKSSGLPWTITKGDNKKDFALTD